MKYTQEDLERAREAYTGAAKFFEHVSKEVTNTANRDVSQNVTPSDQTQKEIKRLGQELLSWTPEGHIEFFNEFKKFTKERIYQEVEKAGQLFSRMKEQTSILDDFIQKELQ